MDSFRVKTNDRTQFVEITSTVQQAVNEQGLKNGLVVVYVPHTTAAVTINENADPDVERDMLFEINKIIPFEDNYHHAEGNSAAHIKASLFGTSQQVIVENGKLQLGTWQGIFFCEFDGPRQRSVWLNFIKSA